MAELVYLVMKVGVVIRGERLPIQEHLPRVWFIEPLEKTDAGALAPTTGAWGVRGEGGTKDDRVRGTRSDQMSYYIMQVQYKV